jgi:hypothetical protein
MTRSRFGANAMMVVLIVPLLLAGCVPVSVTVIVTSPQDEIITFNQADDIVVPSGSVLSVSIGEEFDSYEWMLDGAVLSGQTSADVTIDCLLLEPGAHHLSVFVRNDDRLYSKSLRFTNEN